MYELATLHKPFGTESDLLTVSAIVHDPPTPPSEFVENFPEDLESILMRALDKEPHNRYPSAHEMQEDLERFVQDHGEFLSERDLGKYVTRLFSDDDNDIETVRVGATLYQLLEGRRVQMGMLKVTHIPADMYPDLLEHVERCNLDCRFYIWPGTLAPEINELLLFINLLPKEYALLAAEIDQAVSLPDLLKQRRRLVKLDRRVGALLKLIARRAEEPGGISIEPPFVLEPYVRPYPDELPQLHGVPMLAVGDSVFNGNPKVGNGLAKHLHHLGAIHNAFLVG